MDIVRLGPGGHLVDYHEAWELQRRLHAEVVEGTRPDTVLLVEHPDVYTAGRRTASWDRPVDGTPVVDVDRGGKITWHGPGQLVVYPLVRLREPVDVVAYVRALEDAVIDVCAELGVATDRVAGRSGVWCLADEGREPARPGSHRTGVDAGGRADPLGAGSPRPRRDRKVCAIGVRVARHVTMHGLALNCDPDLSAFGRIVPCGIDDADVTSLSAELGRRVRVEEAEPILRHHLPRALSGVLAAPSPPTDAALPAEEIVR